VYEYIVSGFIGDKSVTFLVVKPFYCTLHDDTSINNLMLCKLKSLHSDTLAHIYKKVNEYEKFFNVLDKKG